MGDENNNIEQGEVSSEKLKSLVVRIEQLEEDKVSVQDDIKFVYAQAKSEGFGPKIIRKVIRLRKTEVEKRREESELTDLYASALGMEI